MLEDSNSEEIYSDPDYEFEEDDEDVSRLYGLNQMPRYVLLYPKVIYQQNTLLFLRHPFQHFCNTF